jgi:hypothetical protein
MSELKDLENQMDINVLLKEISHWQEAYRILYQNNEAHSAKAEQTPDLNQKVLEMMERKIEEQAAEMEKMREYIRLLRRNIQHMRREI